MRSLWDFRLFLRRRGRMILTLALGCFVLVAVLAATRPRVFEATATLQVQPALAGDWAAPGELRHEMAAIQRKLTARAALLAVIERQDPYANRPELSPEAQVSLLRQSVAFETVPADGGTVQAVVVRAHDAEAGMAARLANDFAQGLLDLSAQGQLDRARARLALRRDQETQVVASILALETALSAYRQANAGVLPERAPAWQAELADAEAALRGTEGGSGPAIARRDAALAALARVSEVEAALAGWQVSLDGLRQDLAAVTARRVEAEAEERLALRRQGDRLALLERAATPERPAGPGLMWQLGKGVLASLALAVALAALADLRRPVVRTSEQMARRLGLHPVVAIADLDFPDPGRGATRPR